MSPLSWQHNWQTILRKLRVVRDAGDEQQLIDALSRSEGTTVLGFVNAHAMNLVTANPAYYDALSAADVLLRDGSGMAILYRRLGLEPGLNMNGTDFIPKLLAAYKGRRVAFWGTEETFLANAVRHCEAVFAVNVVSAHHGFAGGMITSTLPVSHCRNWWCWGWACPSRKSLPRDWPPVACHASWYAVGRSWIFSAAR